MYCKSHSGYLISIGDANNIINFSSKKQKHITLSTTESELSSLSDCIEMSIHIKHLLKEFQIDSNIIVYEDNISTIQISKKGPASHGKSKFMAVKINYIHDNIQNNAIAVKYVPTTNQIADIFTKPLQGNLFRKLRSNIVKDHI